MNYNYFVGIDVSKKSLDFAVLEGNAPLFHLQVENNEKGIRQFISHLKANVKTAEQIVFCMEHTGIYNYPLVDYLIKNKYSLSLQSGLQIKQSSGMQRGKNDRVDALRIAMYAYKNRDDLRLWIPKREVLIQLKHYTVLRRRLSGMLKQIQTPLKENKGFTQKKTCKKLLCLCNQTIQAIKQDLKEVDKEIQCIIKNDEELNRLFNLITSVDGIGNVTAVEIIITTNEFKDIQCPKKYACYSGVAPFEHQSGTSIRGKTRVSNLGNKTIKTLLHMACLTSILHNPELKEYYQRKVAEGKNKMLVINAVRNKLIHRVFCCVNQNRYYEKNYSKTLA